MKITSFFTVKKKAQEGMDDVVDDTGSSSSDSSASKRGLSFDSGQASNKREKKRTECVEELVKCLEDKDWGPALRRTFNSASFEQLAEFVSRERASRTIYPPAADTFAALTLTPLDQVRVVIVGQDPYHGPNQAHGLCFSVLPGQAVPPSLKNIYKEAMNDPGVNFTSQPPSHGHLVRWAKQGVLLLNAVLTVRRGQANSHKQKGWEDVTDAILRAVVRHHKAKGVVFLLWGKPAAKKAQAILSTSSASNSKHTIISSSHPSPLGAHKTKQPFVGSCCFSRCNQALIEKGYEPIDWNVDGPLVKSS